MTIIDKIKQTIESLPTEQGSDDRMPFIYADDNIQNILFDRIEPPLVACVPIESAAVQDAGGIIRERLTLAIWFADKMANGTAGDYDAVANEVIIDKCKKRAFRWAASLCPAKELRLISLNGSMRAYLEKDAYLTGYMLNVTIEELEGISRCNL